MVHEVLLEIPPERDHLALVRLVVASTVQLTGALAEARIDDLRLAVSEGCANALDAQVASGSRLPVSVRIVVDPTDVTVTITDHAGGFEPASVEPAPAATDPHRLRHERGLGIPIMRSLVDEARYAATTDGTALALVIHR